MKTLFFRLTLCAIVCLIHTHFNRVGASSLPPTEDYKLDNRHYARTFAANSDVGEPRTVRMIYFLPKDRPYRAKVVQRMKDDISAIQTFFAEQMEAHGYGSRTFRVETDPQGESIVHRVDGEHPYNYYRDLPFGTQVFTSAIRSEILEVFDFNANVYVIVIDNGEHSIYGVGGLGGRGGKASGEVFLPGEFTRTNMAHELGHAFGLYHDFRDDTFIMSYGQQANRLSPCSARYLSVHPHFNSDTRIRSYNGTYGSELISPERYSVGARSVPIQLKVSHLSGKGLRQAILLVYSRSPHPAAGQLEVKACRELAGDRDVIVEFDYDGVIPSDDTTTLSNYMSHSITVITVDTDGNTAWIEFSLAEISPHLITTLEGHRGDVESVSFSPDGTILASGGDDGTVRMWDVVTLQNINTLNVHIGSEAHTSQIWSLSFSPDGTTLAVGGGIFVSSFWDGTVSLWRLDSQQNIATLNGYIGWVRTVSFSPDGTILAFGGDDKTVNLWDVSTQQNITTLEGHTESITSLSFSPDGSLLASGSWEGNVKLWDVETQQSIATLGPTGNVRSVSFSPNGTILASSSHSGIHLWDVATAANITIIGDWLFNVSFSPDGTTLAASAGHYIYLWDVATETEFATFPHTNSVRSLSFSPDGTTLAVGVSDGKIELWDTSRLSQARLEATAEIDIPDPNLRDAIATALGVQPGAPILRGAIIQLSHLEASDADISALTGLEGATKLTSLRLGDNNISDISAVAGLTNLTRLELLSNNISNISAVRGLTNLTSLRLGDNNISDISAVAGLTNLTRLELRSNSISNISAVRGLTKLTSLGLGDNNISDISAVAGLTNLTSLELRSNNISNISAVRGLTNLTGLYLDGNNISDLSPVSGLTKLTYLYLERNNISDLSPLAANTGLETGDAVWLAANPLNYQSLYTYIPVLESRGVEVNFDTQAPPVIADINSDGSVNILDLTLIASGLGNTGANLAADVNRDGVVSILDLILVAGLFEEAATAPSAQPQVPEKLTAIEVQGWLTSARALEARNPIIKRGFVVLEQLLASLIPTETTLLPNYPNPFNPETWIPYHLSEDANVTLTIYDVGGRIVRTLDIGHSKAGIYESRNKAIYWDGKNDLGENVASGVYFYHLEAGEYSATKRMVILK